MNYFPDEFEAAQEARAHLCAYQILRFTLLPLAVVYWLGWLWIPAGKLRAGWTDAPTLLVWLALPEMVRLWTEPDDAGEPKIAGEQEA